MTIPFIERLFNLAAREPSGFVGVLTADSFMKREFGRRLIQDFLPTVELSHVIDTSGSYLPGHGTPTAILLGRARTPDPTTPIHMVVSLRGEPSQPENPRYGVVWQSILKGVDRIGHKDSWIQSLAVDRRHLHEFPWNLIDSSSTELLKRMGESGERLRDRVTRIGYSANTGSDDVFCAPPHSFRRYGVEGAASVSILTGSEVRDWSASRTAEAFFPRQADHSQTVDLGRLPGHFRRLWPYRRSLLSRSAGAGSPWTRPWYDWHHVASVWDVHPWSIVFSWVATHNHFVLLRDPIMPLPSAPVVKLASAASASEHLQLLGLLNSSAVGFWLKHMNQSKGIQRGNQLRSDEVWEEFYEFAPGRLQDLPLPANISINHVEEIDRLGAEVASVIPDLIASDARPTSELIRSAHQRWLAARARMVTLQEEIDWQVYGLYELLPHDRDLISPVAELPAIEVGQRAFEIVLARKLISGEIHTTWFERHRIEPTPEIPDHWSTGYRNLIERRVDAIEQEPALTLLERPEFKRRWAIADWDASVRSALETWLLDRCESPDLWFETRPDGRHPLGRSVRELADLLHVDAEFVEVTKLYAPGSRFQEIVRDLMVSQHVPCAAPLRYRLSGMAKWEQWNSTWDLQLLADSALPVEAPMTEGVTYEQIPVPPKFTASDFRSPYYWRNRGKLDVPNERFTSYTPPFSALSFDTVLGWAGWDARERAEVLLRLLDPEVSGHSAESAMPLLAGLREMLSWIPRRGRGLGPFEATKGFRSMQAEMAGRMDQLGVTPDEVTTWRPPEPKRGRKPKSV
jgi:hypothetical protein